MVFRWRQMLPSRSVMLHWSFIWLIRLMMGNWMVRLKKRQKAERKFIMFGNMIWQSLCGRILLCIFHRMVLVMLWMDRRLQDIMTSIITSLFWPLTQIGWTTRLVVLGADFLLRHNLIRRKLERKTNGCLISREQARKRRWILKMCLYQTKKPPAIVSGIMDRVGQTEANSLLKKMRMDHIPFIIKLKQRQTLHLTLWFCMTLSVTVRKLI